jgi:hypothetical protein
MPNEFVKEESFVECAITGKKQISSTGYVYFEIAKAVADHMNTRLLLGVSFQY